jgi:hypothetical protein
MGVPTMTLLSPRMRLPVPGFRGLVGARGGVTLGYGLVAVLVAHMLLRPQTAPDTEGWKLADLVEHLQARGLRLQVIWGLRGTGPYDHAYLTEDPDATRASLEGKPRVVERVHQWRGTVWVGCDVPGLDMEEDPAAWGPNGCRIGHFLLVGDDRLLRRIQDACREPSRRSTLGAAQNPAGQCRDALATLAGADRDEPGTPAALAFLTLARHQLGQLDQAQATLARLRDAVGLPRWANDEEAARLLREAEAVLLTGGAAAAPR